MRSIIFVLWCCIALLVPSAVGAQTYDGQLSTLYQELIPTSKLPRNYPPDPHMLPHDHAMFSWYDTACCSNNDCRAFDESVVTEHADGSVVVRHIDPFFGEMDIVFDAKKFHRRPNGAPPDPYWHFCFQVFQDSDTLEPVVRTYCMYKPDTSM